MINFYHMQGCHYCVTAKNELQNLIDCGKVIELGHEGALNKGVQGFPYFELVDDNKVLKTSRGWAGKANLFNDLGYTPTCENYQENYLDMNHQNTDMNHQYTDMNQYMNHQNYHMNNPITDMMNHQNTDMNQYMNHQNYHMNNQITDMMNHQNTDMNHQVNSTVVEHMETVSTDVLYGHHRGGYLKLSDCWVKQPNYTA